GVLQQDLECRFVELAGDAPRDDFAVPRVQKDADAALWRQRAPIAPRRRTRQLFACALAERDDANMPRIHPFGELVGGLAAAAAFDAADDEQHRPALRLRQIE